jgi:hypothetical protein
MRVLGILLIAMLVLVASPSFATHPDETAPQDTREFFVDETKLPFNELAGFPSTRLWGIDNGAGFRIEVPANWNGDLVVYTHGFRGAGAELTVDTPSLRPYFLQNGFAWAASSYSKNNYDVRSGVESTNSLVRYFKANVGEPDQTFITGFSMGGHVIGAAIEQFPNVACPSGPLKPLCERLVEVLGELSGGVKWDGAAPFCGVMGDLALFQYFGDFNYVAETLAGVTSQFPPPPDYATTTRPATLAALYVNPDAINVGGGTGAVLNDQGLKLRAFTTQVSGGARPYADTSFRFFQQLLFSFGGADGTVGGIVGGNIFDNKHRVYQLDGNPALTPDEQALNDLIIRIRKDPHANQPELLRVRRIPIITGNIDIPVVSTHTLGDLFVPFSMEQIYAREAKAFKKDKNLVSRATRAVSHCEFSAQELVESFSAMTAWVNGGVKPAGDNILDAATVADPNFGCQFSRGTVASRPLAPPCPAP